MALSVMGGAGAVARLTAAIGARSMCTQIKKENTESNFLANPEVVAYSRRRRFTKGLIKMPFVSLRSIMLFCASMHLFLFLSFVAAAAAAFFFHLCLHWTCFGRSLGNFAHILFL